MKVKREQNKLKTGSTNFKMAGRQISTAISDLVLAISASFVALHVMPNHPFAAIGISFQGLAALIGIVRFSMDPCNRLVFDAHKTASWVATLVSLPGLATGFYNHFAVPYLTLIMMLLCGFIFFFGCYMEKEVRKNVAEMFAGLSVLSVIVICLYHQYVIGLVACALYVLAGTVGAEGSFAGIPRVDILHYLLVVGNVAFMKALT